MRPSSYSYRVHTQKKQYLEDLHNRRMEIVKEGTGGVLLFCCFLLFIHVYVCVTVCVCTCQCVCLCVCMSSHAYYLVSTYTIYIYCTCA